MPRSSTTSTDAELRADAPADGPDRLARAAVRVFVSSTFRDMAAEREHLVKLAYPRLRRFCEERGVELTVVDLRWGITREQAEAGRVLQLCLREVDRCRPYFVALLGDRYGWSPPSIDPATLAEFPWVRVHPGASLTELEIRHGVLNAPSLAPDARFYLREPAAGGAGGEDAAGAARLQALREELRAAGLVAMDGYRSAADVAERVRSDLEAIIERDYPRSGGLGRPADRGVHQEMLGQGGAPVGVTLRTLRRSQLWSALYGRAIQGTFVGRREELERLDRFAAGDAPVLGVRGPLGIGKSALVARWAERVGAQRPVAVAHVGPFATRPGQVIEQLAYQLEDLLGLGHGPHADVRAPVPLRDVLSAAGARDGAVLVVDGDPGWHDAETLREAGAAMPPRVRMVVTSRSAEALGAILPPGAEVLELANLSTADQRELVVAHLAQHGKVLDERQLGAVLAQPARTPSELVTLLDELRAFGRFEALDAFIEALAGARGREALYEAVLARLEADLGAPGSDPVRQLLAAVHCSPAHELPETDAAALLGVDPLAWAQLHDVLRHLVGDDRLRLVDDDLARVVERRYLANHEERTRVHRQLADHIARHPSPRGNAALVHHLTNAREPSRLRGALLDLELVTTTDEEEWRRGWAALAGRYDPDAEGVAVVAALGTRDEPRLGFSLWMLGVRFRRLGARTAAAAALGRSAEVGRGDPSSATWRALALHELRELFDEWRSALAAKDDPAVRLALAAALARDAERLDPSEAEARDREALEAVAPLADDAFPLLPEVLADLGWHLIVRGEDGEAAACHARARALLQRRGARGTVLAKVSCGEGFLAISAGEPSRALGLLEGARAELEHGEGDHRELAAIIQAGIGRARGKLGDDAEAERALLDALARFEALGPGHPAIPGVLHSLHRLCERTGRPEDADALRRRGADRARG